VFCLLKICIFVEINLNLFIRVQQCFQRKKLFNQMILSTNFHFLSFQVDFYDGLQKTGIISDNSFSFRFH
jgi:hypothetical protein